MIVVLVSFLDAVEFLHKRGRKLGRFVRLSTGRWLVVPAPDFNADRPI